MTRLAMLALSSLALLSGCKETVREVVVTVVTTPTPSLTAAPTPTSAPATPTATATVTATGTPSPPCDSQAAVRRATLAVVPVTSSLGGGSGFFVTADGHVVTSAHLVEGADQGSVVLGGVPASVWAASDRMDLAVLKVETEVPGVLEWGDSFELTPPEPLSVVGFPRADALGSTPSVTRGAFSAMREVDGVFYIQFDAAANPGNSGGPVIDDCGEVVGVVRTKVSDAEGLVLALASASARPETESLIGNPPAPPAGEKFAIGDTVEVNTHSFAPLALRYGHSLSSEVFRNVENGMLLPFVDGPAREDGLVWWGVSGGGWAVEENLQHPGTEPIPTPDPNTLRALEETVGLFYVSLDIAVVNPERFPRAYDFTSRRFRAAHPYATWKAGYSTTLWITVEYVRAFSVDPPLVDVQVSAGDYLNGSVVDRRWAGTWQLVWEDGAWRLDYGDIRQVQ